MEERFSNSVKDLHRSNAHPIITLAESTAFTTNIHIELGYTSYHDKNSIAKIFGLSYESIKQKLSTSCQYQQLDLKHGVGYKITPQFLSIYKPENEKERREAILACLRSPSLYEKLIAEYDGHTLPSQIGLSTSLFRRFGLSEKAAERAAEVFLENMQQNGLISSDNRLLFSTVTENRTNNGFTETIEAEDVYKNPAKEIKMLPYVEYMQTGYLEIPIPLKDGRKAIIKVPENAASEDYERIAKVINGYT